MKIFRFESLDSTQIEAERLLKRGAMPPFFVVAAEQTAGRGRLGRKFYSPKDRGLYITAVLPSVKTGKTAVTCITAVRLVKALESLGFPDLKIKWVNDLMLRDRKVGGIITENKAGAIFVGVGLNLIPGDFPPDIRDRAGSLSDGPDRGIEGAARKKTAVDFPAVEAAVTEALLSLYVEESSEAETAFYRERSYLTGKKVHCLPLDLFGTVMGIDDTGAMLLKTETGITTISGGEVTVVPMPEKG